MLQFIVNRRQIAIGGMEAFAVVKDFNILKYSLSSLRPGLISLMMYRFGFQGVDEAFRNRILQTVTFTVPALPDAVLG
jgi:hypothetical protein